MTMKEFLTFQTFITPSLLLLIYCVGAVFIPILSWYLAKWIKNSYFSEISTTIEEDVKIDMTFNQRLIMTIIFFLCFLCMEIVWRVMFEFFIAYFDMHDALMKLT